MCEIWGYHGGEDDDDDDVLGFRTTDKSTRRQNPEQQHRRNKFYTTILQVYYRAVPWLRRLVAGLSPRRPGFAPGSIQWDLW
jgi:hypothetical protein